MAFFFLFGAAGLAEQSKFSTNYAMPRQTKIQFFCPMTGLRLGGIVPIYAKKISGRWERGLLIIIPTPDTVERILHQPAFAPAEFEWKRNTKFWFWTMTRTGSR
jgi:hypothetical protein